MFDQLLKKLRNPESLLSLVLGTAVVVVAGMLLVNTVKNRPASEVSKTPTQTGATGAVSETVVNRELPAKHKVKEGENLWEIAVSYYKSGYNWVTIAGENKLVNPDFLMVDQELTIPKAEAIYPAGTVNGNGASAITENTYKVQKGDNLWDISCRAYANCYKWSEIAKANSIANPDNIEIGQLLKLPR